MSIENLPSSVKVINVDEKEIYLVGTAHVSKESVQDVEKTVELVQPDTICVELCESRYKTAMDRDNWKKLDIFKVIKEKKAVMLLAQLIMSSFYKKIGDQLGVKPGAEMYKGIELAQKDDKELVLADRNIEITLKRVWGYLNFWNKLKMMSHIMASMFVSEKVDSDTIEELKNQDQLEAVMAMFAQEFPGVKTRLIDERDIYLAQKIKEATGQKIVAVLGAGHLPGIQKHIQNDNDVTEITQLPPKSITPTLFKWGIPLAIIALLLIGFLRGGAEHSLQSIYIWILVNGILSALGAAIAFGHPLTVISAFIGAPITSLNPMIAAGWVAGLVQAWVKKPTVEDFEDLPNAISSVKGFWMNPVSRILLVVVLANLGSSLGTFISGSWLAVRTF